MSDKLSSPPNFRFIVMDNYGNTKEYPPNPDDAQMSEIVYSLASARSKKLLVYELVGTYHTGSEYPFK